MLIVDIMNKYPNAKKLNIILDNAGYKNAKLMHKKLSYCRRYQKFTDFQNAVLGFLDNTTKYTDQLTSLMTENFNIIQPTDSNFILD